MLGPFFVFATARAPGEALLYRSASRCLPDDLYRPSIRALPPRGSAEGITAMGIHCPGSADAPNDRDPPRRRTAGGVPDGRGRRPGRPGESLRT